MRSEIEFSRIFYCSSPLMALVEDEFKSMISFCRAMVRKLISAFQIVWSRIDKGRKNTPYPEILLTLAEFETRSMWHLQSISNVIHTELLSSHPSVPKSFYPSFLISFLPLQINIQVSS